MSCRDHDRSLTEAYPGMERDSPGGLMRVLVWVIRAIYLEHSLPIPKGSNPALSWRSALNGGEETRRTLYMYTAQYAVLLSRISHITPGASVSTQPTPLPPSRPPASLPEKACPTTPSSTGSSPHLAFGK